MPLKQRKQIFEINVTELRIPTGRRQTSWLFTKRDRGFELGTTEKQIPLVAGCRSWTQHQRPKPLSHSASREPEVQHSELGTGSDLNPGHIGQSQAFSPLRHPLLPVNFMTNYGIIPCYHSNTTPAMHHLFITNPHSWSQTWEQQILLVLVVQVPFGG